MTRPTSSPPPATASASASAAGWRGELGILVVVLVWGLNFSVMKGAFEGVDPFLFNALRFTLSVVFLGIWAHAFPERQVGERAAPPSRLGLRVLLLGLCGHGIYQALFAFGLDHTSSGNSALLIATSPLWTAFLAHVTHIERVRARAWTGLVVAFLGTALLVTTSGSGAGAGGASRTGDLVTLVAAAAWASYTTFSKPLVPVVGALSLTWRTSASALPVLWAFALPGLRHGFPALGAGTWLCVLFSGLGPTGLAYVLWNRSIHRIGPSQTSVYVNLVPVLALASGLVFLGEAVTAGQLLGGACILAGVVQARRAR